MEGGFISQIYHSVSNSIRHARREQENFQNHLENIGIARLVTMTDDQIRGEYRPTQKDRHAVYVLSWPSVSR